jgi:hypothetical protein
MGQVHLFSWRNCSANNATGPNGKGVYLQILESLLIHGAKPERAVVKWDKKPKERGTQVGISDYIGSCIGHTPKEVIMRLFSREETEWVLSKA